MPPIGQLMLLNYDDPNVTSLSHLITIHNFAKYFTFGLALEIGSYQGHSTLALASAIRTVSYDISPEWEQQRQEFLKDYNVEWHLAGSYYALQETRSFDIIFHDADHGNSIVPELVGFWDKVKPGGLLIVHDTEQITIPLPFNPLYQTKDNRGRELSVYLKG